MAGGREAFLGRVREALAAGRHPGAAPSLPPEREGLAWQGAGADPVVGFCAALAAAGGEAHVVSDPDQAAAKVVELVRAAGARRVLLGGGRFVEPLGLRGRLAAIGVDVTAVQEPPATDDRAALFAAEVGVSGVAHLIGETGSLVLASGPGEPRSLGLLPPVHVAVGDESQILPDLFDLFAGPIRDADGGLPSCVCLATGPSKTGDIELRLVRGVHGPGVVHVVLISRRAADGSLAAGGAPA